MGVALAGLNNATTPRDVSVSMRLVRSSDPKGDRSAGKTVSWEEQRGSKDVVTHFGRGMSKLDEKSYVGLAYPLSEPGNVKVDAQKGHLLLLRSLDDLRANPADIAGAH